MEKFTRRAALAAAAMLAAVGISMVPGTAQATVSQDTGWPYMISETDTQVDPVEPSTDDTAAPSRQPRRAVAAKLLDTGWPY